MRYTTPNATKKGLLPDEMAVPSERTETDNLFAAEKHNRRMGEICATPEEVQKYKFDPNAARRNIRPGIPDEDYNQISD